MGFKHLNVFKAPHTKTQRLQLGGERGSLWHCSLAHLKTSPQPCDRTDPEPHVDFHNTSRKKKKRQKKNRPNTLKAKQKCTVPPGVQPVSTQQDQPRRQLFSVLLRSGFATTRRFVGKRPRSSTNLTEVGGLTHSSESCGVKEYVGIRNGLLEFHSGIRNAF